MLIVFPTQAGCVGSVVMGQLINSQNVWWRDIACPHIRNTSGCVCLLKVDWIPESSCAFIGPSVYFES